MGDFKQAYQIETIKAQCCALTAKGCAITFTLNPRQSLSPIAVTMFHKQKMYHFSDPDLEVIISQLCTFHAGLNKFINLMEAKHGKVQAR